nr:DUF2470 domain-containing protein [Aurantimonas sp. VKM B-3413]
MQPVDDAARQLARRLIRGARHGALAVLRPADGFPAASRVLLASDFTGRPILLVSGLSLHAKALANDTRCSLLVGETGKGDPLAHPRLTVFAEARFIPPEDHSREGLRERFLARHQKSALYADFPDFRFGVLEPLGAALNGGFARAFELTADDLLDETLEGLEAAALRARDHMNADHGDAVDMIASRHVGETKTGWRIATLDRTGFEIVRGDTLHRIEFPGGPVAAGGYRDVFVELVRQEDPSKNATD